LCDVYGTLTWAAGTLEPMRIFAFIPARYESSRSPGKPLKAIDGRAMIQHVYERACSCKEMEEVYVATDDERILREVNRFGGKAVMTGSQHLSGSDRIAEAANIMGLKDDDLIVNIQGDQPLFEPSSVVDLIQPFRTEGSEIPMSTLMYHIRDQDEVEDSNIVKVVTDRNGWALFFSRSPIPFYREPGSNPVFYKHLGLYAYRLRFLRKFASLPPGRLESAEKLEQLRALENGYRIKVVETDEDSLEIDTPEDIKKAEKIIAQRKARSA
jgi:3-deoxy-manno-octulosonate cytidylyltransferase (CMP-KDO synthetase)